MVPGANPLSGLGSSGLVRPPVVPGRPPAALTPNALSGLAGAPAPMPVAAPVHSMPPSPAAVAQRHVGIALAGHETLPSSEIARRSGHAAKSLHVIAALLAKPNLNFIDVTRALLNAADDGAISHTQALDMVGKMPSDRSGLYGFLAYLQQAAAQSHGMLSAEQHRRVAAGRGFRE